MMEEFPTGGKIDQGRKKGQVNVALRFALSSIGVLGLGAVALTGCGSSGSSNASAVASSSPTTLKDQLFVDADTVSTAKATTCWLMNRFHPGDKVLFRAKVFDGATGNVLTNKDLKSVVVGLPNGQNLPATYGNHKTDNFWAIAWTVPADYQTGTINYTVTATSNQGATGQWVPFKIASSSLTILAPGAS